MVPMTTESIQIAAVSRDDRLVAAQAKQLYMHASLGMSATVINSLILVAVLRNHADRLALSVWWVTLAFVSAARYMHAHHFNARVSKGRFDGRRWTSSFIVGIGVTGVIWGLSGVVLFPSSVPHQSFIAFVLGGMVAGAAATFSVRMDAFLAFTIPALAPLIGQLLRQGGEYHTAMGAMILLFGLLLTGTAYRVHSLVNTSLREELASGESANVSALSTEDQCLTARDGHAHDETLIAARQEAHAVRSDHSVQTERAKLDSLATFARGVSHRIADYNATISENVHVALRNPDLFESAVSRDMLHRLDGTASAAEALVEQLVEYSDEHMGHFRAVDLSDETGRALDDWKSPTDSGVEVQRHFTQSLPAVRADPGQIRTVLTHLLTNADEASPKNGKIEVRTGFLPLFAGVKGGSTAELGPTKRMVFVEVVDDGAGMPEDVNDKLFDPFFTTKGVGRGMGMAIVLAVARRHNATVTVASSAPSGTRVRLKFPVS